MASVAASFVASDKSWLQIADADQTGLDPGTGDFSISFFVRLTSLPSIAYTFARKGSPTSTGGGYLLQISISGALRVNFSDGTSPAIQSDSPTTLAAGQWYNVLWLFDRDGNLSIVVDGVTVHTVDISSRQGAIDNTPQFLLAATNSLGVEAVNGSLSHLRFWNRLLTPAEIARQSNMADGVPHARPYAQLSAAEKVGLVSAWDMQDGPYSASQQATDSHGSNHLSFAASPIISPTVLNGGFETAGAGGADVFTTWAEVAPGDTLIAADATNPYAGTQSCRLDVDAANSHVRVNQNALTLGKDYDYSYYARASTAGVTVARYTPSPVDYHSLTTSWALYSGVIHDAASVYFGFSRVSPANESIWFDNITLTAAEILTAEGPLTTSTPVVVESTFIIDDEDINVGQTLIQDGTSPFVYSIISQTRIS